MNDLQIYNDMAEAHWHTYVNEDDVNDGRPPGYLEITLPSATICVGLGSTAIILFEDVGGTRMYTLHIGLSTPPRDDTRGPYHSSAAHVYEFYGRALQEARGACGWDWEAHPQAEQHEGYVSEFSPIVGRVITRDTHPSLTKGERNK